MWLGVSIYAAYVAATFVGTTIATPLPLSVHSSNTNTRDDHHGPITSRSMQSGGRRRDQTQDKSLKETDIISPIDIPFKQRHEEWESGKGISMDLSGEAKSGTTWTARMMTQVAIQLCRSPSNPWCKMGGLTVTKQRVAPVYVWEMLYADSGDLYIHFETLHKHHVPGFNVGRNCTNFGNFHSTTFAKVYPCKNHANELSREKLLQCLPDTSDRCAQLMPSRDPAIRKMVVVFRDPRDVVISMVRHTEGDSYVENIAFLDHFIQHRFKILVSWMHQRWVWHTTYYKDVSHIIIYEEMKSCPSSLIDLAAFFGLDCSPEEALRIWHMHEEISSNGDYNSYGLPLQTISWMNSTMMALLPEELILKWIDNPER